MKRFIFSFLIVCFVSLSLRAQIGAARKEKSIDLNEATVRASGLKLYQKKARRSSVWMQLAPTNLDRPPSWDSTYFLTKLFLPDSMRKIKITYLQCRIHPFDTSLFTLQLVVVQLNNKDTLFRIIPIKNIHDIKRKRLTLDLREQNLILHPGGFLLGYGFQAKKISDTTEYELYSTWGGDGTLLKVKNAKWNFITSAGLPYVFPFIMSYLTL